MAVGWQGLSGAARLPAAPAPRQATAAMLPQPTQAAAGPRDAAPQPQQASPHAAQSEACPLGQAKHGDAASAEDAPGDQQQAASGNRSDNNSSESIQTTRATMQCQRMLLLLVSCPSNLVSCGCMAPFTGNYIVTLQASGRVWGARLMSGHWCAATACRRQTPCERAPSGAPARHPAFGTGADCSRLQKCKHGGIHVTVIKHHAMNALCLNSLCLNSLCRSQRSCRFTTASLLSAGSSELTGATEQGDERVSMGAGKRLTLQQLQVCLGMSHIQVSAGASWRTGCQSRFADTADVLTECNCLTQAQFGCGLKEAAGNLGICPTSAICWEPLD